MLKYLLAFAFLLVATSLESFGDATVRIGLYSRVGIARAPVLMGGAALLFGYGVMLNLAPLPFERHSAPLPSLPVLLGGALIVAGGLVVTFWPQSGA